MQYNKFSGPISKYFGKGKKRLVKEMISARLIDQAFSELAGPDFTNRFWKLFKDYYGTRKDINYIKSKWINTIRVPFHFKLFTEEDNMGLSSGQDGLPGLTAL